MASRQFGETETTTEQRRVARLIPELVDQLVARIKNFHGTFKASAPVYDMVHDTAMANRIDRRLLGAALVDALVTEGYMGIVGPLPSYLAPTTPAATRKAARMKTRKAALTASVFAVREDTSHGWPGDRLVAAIERRHARRHP